MSESKKSLQKRQKISLQKKSMQNSFAQDLEKRIFLICPVAQITEQEKQEIAKYKQKLHKENYRVHNPNEHTHQNDPIGIAICYSNRNAIVTATKGVHIFYNPTSNGSVFDLGITFYHEKPLKVINPKKVEENLHNDVAGFILKYAKNNDANTKFYDWAQKTKDEIESSDVVIFDWKGKTIDFMFRLGLAFSAHKPIRIVSDENREEVKKYIKEKPGKTFENMLLHLDAMHGGVPIEYSIFK